MSSSILGVPGHFSLQIFLSISLPRDEELPPLLPAARMSLTSALWTRYWAMDGFAFSFSLTCGGLNENIPHRLRYLSPWSLVCGGTVW